MKPNELRIGNLINYNGGQPEDEDLLNTVDWQDLQWITERKDEFNSLHKPILLTEEWLVKFGFDRINNSLTSRLYSNNVFEIMTNGYIYHFWIYDNTEGGFEINIKNVHQLQNLYFALTGEELTIKE